MDECSEWVQRVHRVQSARTPEAMEEARARFERARQHEVSSRKCRAVKGHAIRSEALAAESLRQMSSSATPALQMEVQDRWRSAQQVSRTRQVEAYAKAESAIRRNWSGSRSGSRGYSVMSDASEEEEEAMAEVAGVVGASDASALAALALPVGPTADAGKAKSAVETLLEQLRVEPADATECTAKFMLYEGYSSEVQEMRETLLKFYAETIPTVPAALANDVTKQVKGIDSTEAMGIPDESREWFVYHMMKQAAKNNQRMAQILDQFERKLQLLASNDQTECPVCLEAFQDNGPQAPETLACCHKVCKECWETWGKVTNGRPFCPLCRHEDFLGFVSTRARGDESSHPDDM
jgi:hypothetical protein